MLIVNCSQSGTPPRVWGWKTEGYGLNVPSKTLAEVLLPPWRPWEERAPTRRLVYQRCGVTPSPVRSISFLHVLTLAMYCRNKKVLMVCGIRISDFPTGRLWVKGHILFIICSIYIITLNLAEIRRGHGGISKPLQVLKPKGVWSHLPYTISIS